MFSSLEQNEGACQIPGLRIVVLVPCYNEESTVGQVVDAFSAALPTAVAYVYDNNSTDRTAEVAAAHGAVVRHEATQGKGNVVRRMFADIEADVYVLVDGDATYHAPSAPAMIEALLCGGLDMVTGKRDMGNAEAYRPGHRFGNRLLTTLVALVFGQGASDMLSGYRVLSRRFVKTFPAHAGGFEIETELTVHALEIRMAVAELATPYHARPSGSASKLSTYRDGLRILRTIANLVRDERPLAFFSVLGFLCLAVAVVLAVPIVMEFAETGLVPRFPTAILSTGLSLVGIILFSCGLVLDTVSRGRREVKRLFYLSFPGRNGGPAR